MKFIAIVLVLGTTLFSCKNNKTAAEVSAPVNTPVYSSNHSDSTFFSMRKTSCLGQCPTYNLFIKHSGEANIEAKYHLPFEGNLTSTFSTTELDSIKSLLKTCNYFNLEKTYDGPITDIPATITQVYLDDKTNRVKNRYKGPIPLKQLELYVHGLVMAKEWKLNLNQH